MSINCTDKEGLEKFMSDNLKESRYRHSLGVEDMAVRLAEAHGADAEKAAFAGRYHDIAKCLSPDEMNHHVEKYGLPSMYLDNIPLAHSKVAAEILKDKFGVDDEDVLNAVRSHTTGRENMSLLEEVVYVADAIEDNRSYPGLKKLQREALEDLDSACLFIMDYTIDTLKKKGRAIDADTINAREYIAEKIRRNNGK